MAFVKIAEPPKPPKPKLAAVDTEPSGEPSGMLSRIGRILNHLAAHKESGITKQSAKQLQDRINQEHELGMDRRTGYTGD